MLSPLLTINNNNKVDRKTSILPVDVDSRFELKYRLSYFQYLKVRNAIQPYMIMDPYTKTQSANRYVVRSLYFDTHNYHAYHQKMSGESDRAKFRLRTYPNGIEFKTHVRVEIKLRQGNRSIKKSAFVPIEKYHHFMNNRHWEGINSPIAIEFERQCITKTLFPKVLVEYDREGYQTKLKSNLRITFDHRLRCAHSKTLFPENPFFRFQVPTSVVLEIKFKDSPPFWLERVARDQGLKVIANSKFTQSIQIARHDLYYPDKVIMVR